MQDLLHAHERPEPIWTLTCSFSLQLCPQKQIQTSNLFYSRQIIFKLNPSPLERILCLLLFAEKLQ